MFCVKAQERPDMNLRMSICLHSGALASTNCQLDDKDINSAL